MILKTIVLVLLIILSISSVLGADSKQFTYVAQNNENNRITVVYYDANKQQILMRVLKTNEKSLVFPQNIASISEISPSGKYEIIDDRDYSLIVEKEAQTAKEVLNKYNKSSIFLKTVNEVAFKPCSTTSPAQLLKNSGNALNLTNMSLLLADKLVADNNQVVFKLNDSQNEHLLSAQLGTKGEILALNFVDSNVAGDNKSKNDMRIIGPQNEVAYLKKGSQVVLKVATENFSDAGGDFIVTIVDPAPSRADFIEHLYHITINGNKMTVNPRQIITPTLDFSTELQPDEGLDKKPFALGLQNFLANVVWGGGKEKTQKEIIKAGNAAIKDDPLLKQYLTEADVERIAQRIVQDGIVINKNAISEKPKVTGIAYIYFSEELLKKAILEQIPMSESELSTIVTNVMSNFRTCIAEAKFTGGVEDCKNKFSKTAVIKVARNLLFQQIDLNFSGAISGPGAKQDLADAKAKAEIEFNRCTNKNFIIPAELAEKNKTPPPDQMKVGIGCVYSSMQYALTGVVEKELIKTYNSMKVSRPGDENYLSTLRKANDSCYQSMGIVVDEIGRRYDMNRLQNQSVDNFKTQLINCANKQIASGGRMAVQRLLETHPDLTSILKSANISETKRANFVKNILTTGYDSCIADLEKNLPKGSIINPTNCESYITLKAKEDAFKLILQNELKVVKTKPDPWESDISPSLSTCTNNFFKDYMSKKSSTTSEQALTACFRDAIASAGYYIGGAILQKEIVENPAIKPYGITLSEKDKEKYQGMIKTCMAKELKGITRAEDLTVIDSKAKKNKLEIMKDKCTINVAQVIVPDLAKDILRIEMGKAIAGEKPEDQTKLQAQLDKIINPIIESDLLPRMAKIQGMDDVTNKVLPAFTTEATLKSASVILDFKLSGFAKNPESKMRMNKVRDSLLTDLRKELNGGGSLTPQIMEKVENKATTLVTNTLIDQYLGKKYPKVAQTLVSTIDQNFIKAMTEVKFVTPNSNSDSNKPLNMAELADVLGKYIGEALAYDPTIVSAVKDLQKKMTADIAAQKKAGQAPTISIDKMMKDYWNHPAIKKIVLSQVSKELNTSFTNTLKSMESEELRNLKDKSNLDLVTAKYKNLRLLTTNATTAKQMEAMFSTAQGAKALASVRDHMLMPMLTGRPTTTQDKAAVTLEIGKTLIENRKTGSFAERFTAYNLQSELTADQRSRGKVVKGIMTVLGYKLENYDWDNLKNTPSGRQALNYFNEQILLPSVVGQQFNMDERKKTITELIKQGLKGD